MLKEEKQYILRVLDYSYKFIADSKADDEPTIENMQSVFKNIRMPGEKMLEDIKIRVTELRNAFMML